MYGLVAMEELLSSLVQLCKSQGKHCGHLWVSLTCGQNVNADAVVLSSGIMGALAGRAVVWRKH